MVCPPSVPLTGRPAQPSNGAAASTERKALHVMLYIVFKNFIETREYQQVAEICSYIGRFTGRSNYGEKTLAARERNEDALYDKRGNTYRGRQSVTGSNRQLSAFNKSLHRISAELCARIGSPRASALSFMGR